MRLNKQITFIASLSALACIGGYGSQANFVLINDTGYVLDNMSWEHGLNSDNHDRHEVITVPSNGELITQQVLGQGGEDNYLVLDKQGCNQDGHHCGAIEFSGHDAGHVESYFVSSNEVVNNPNKSNAFMETGSDNGAEGQPLATPQIACAVPDASAKAWSDDADNFGYSYLFPSILEARVNLCVQLVTPASADTAYTFKIDNANGFAMSDDLTQWLHPQIADRTTITLPNSSGTNLGSVLFHEGDGGQKCVVEPFYFKTNSTACHDLLGNLSNTGINAAQLVIDVNDASGKQYSFTLRPYVNMEYAQDGSVNGVYALGLVAQGTQFSIVPNDAGIKPYPNASACAKGVCSNTTITFNPNS
ncbi:hypothetical protein [Cysteiniphilum sp. 6C5]|uniref:hypothetical protein n=1 Tax=unclassified Cysteiniphilum TaxID=2610889 RepID=UPI003F83542B